MKYLLTPITDYIFSRKKIWLCYAISTIPSLVLLVVSFSTDIQNGYDILSLFSDFVDSQVNIIAILLSFSIAILTILATTDNENIRKLKEKLASPKNYNEIKNVGCLTLFQVLFSSVTYNILCQILYLSLLIVESLAKAVFSSSVYKYLAAVNVFFITHIFYILIESVINTYYVFWKDFHTPWR